MDIFKMDCGHYKAAEKVIQSLVDEGRTFGGRLDRVRLDEPDARYVFAYKYRVSYGTCKTQFDEHQLPGKFANALIQRWR